MAMHKKKIDAKAVENTGLGTAVSEKYARFINKDGSHNVVTRGRNIFERYSIYSFLINMRGWKFVILILTFYTTINFVFAAFYYLFCIPHLQGLIVGTPLETFEEAYFFSSQTLTTVGYGRISPTGFITNTIASFEALIGILSLAIITGLLYGRFVKPRAHLRFSESAVVAPFKEGRGLMFRLAPIKNAMLSDVSLQVALSMMIEENGKKINRYFSLPLQISSINTLTVTWTVVHPIDETSPLYQLSAADLETNDAEVLVFVRAFDENFANTVIARSSYTYAEIIHGAKFLPAFYDSPKGEGTIVDHRKLNDYIDVPLP
ncbi:MAG TPA: ion channel [Flavihumibacter sp.]|nr:Ion transport 2 domain protein [Bacteroidota bacterium]HOA39229.1 ion channel [Flavihumibacter sp.]HPZ88937.1 ion channel [Flavihumibacter sp.]